MLRVGKVGAELLADHAEGTPAGVALAGQHADQPAGRGVWSTARAGTGACARTSVRAAVVLVVGSSRRGRRGRSRRRRPCGAAPGPAPAGPDPRLRCRWLTQARAKASSSTSPTSLEPVEQPGRDSSGTCAWRPACRPAPCGCAPGRSAGRAGSCGPPTRGRPRARVPVGVLGLGWPAPAHRRLTAPRQERVARAATGALRSRRRSARRTGVGGRVDRRADAELLEDLLLQLVGQVGVVA